MGSSSVKTWLAQRVLVNQRWIWMVLADALSMQLVHDAVINSSGPGQERQPLDRNTPRSEERERERVHYKVSNSSLPFQILSSLGHSQAITRSTSQMPAATATITVYRIERCYWSVLGMPFDIEISIYFDIYFKFRYRYGLLISRYRFFVFYNFFFLQF